jgi:hypothetical protein
MVILHWQENLVRDEMPPEWMWCIDHELEIWFERIEAERDERYGREERERVPMMQNELTEDLRRAG